MAQLSLLTPVAPTQTYASARALSGKPQAATSSTL
jgi:hypothetical protein